VTHRCHNREFLLKFALDRDGYCAKLREHLPDFDVALLDCCITSLPRDHGPAAAVSGAGSGTAVLASAGRQPGGTARKQGGKTRLRAETELLIQLCLCGRKSSSGDRRLDTKVSVGRWRGS
jgi:hypothetical protein